MPIALTDVDSLVGSGIEGVRRRLIWTPRDAADVELRRQLQTLRLGKRRRLSAWSWAGIATWSSAWVLGPLITFLEPGEPWGLLVGGLLLTAGGGLALLGALKAHRLSGKGLDPAELRLLLPHLDLDEVGKLYAGCVCLLIENDALLDSTTEQGLLRELNQLLISHRHLGEQELRIRSASGVGPAGALEEERADLAARAEAQQDPIAKQALAQSLALCSERLERARALEPHRQRLEAQREVIEQTLASVQSSLAGMKAMPGAAGTPELQCLQQSVLQVTGQSRSLEQAAQEVLAIKG